jgi:hypothetical protein
LFLDLIKGRTNHPQCPVDKNVLGGQAMKATTRRSLRRAWYLAGNWQVPAHIGLALGMGLTTGIIAQRYPSLITPLAAVIIGTFILYPLMLTVWWRLNR